MYTCLSGHKRCTLPRESTPRSIRGIEKRIGTLLQDLARTHGDEAESFPFLLPDDHITPQTVDKVFDELQQRFGSTTPNGRLVVVVDSSGGDIDAAYNLALLFRNYGAQRLTYVVPRWAKSAATLLVCGGDTIVMTPVAELGPLDPQITQVNPLEQRVESFSPLHVESTLELIRNEFSQGNRDLAEGLLQRLQFPITLGSFKKSLEVGKQYAKKLLESRMLSDELESAARVAESLVEGYADHGFCINFDEALALGLKVERPSGEQLKLIWDLHRLTRKMAELRSAQRDRELQEKLEQLTPGIQDGLQVGPVGRGPHSRPREEGSNG